MATLKDIEIYRRCGVRPNNNIIYAGRQWGVEKGEPYDFVQFSINELNKPYFWRKKLCLKCDLTEEQIKNEVEEYIKNITEEDIKEYKCFLEDGEQYGWD